MTSVPILSYREIVRALPRDGWVIIRQRGSHIRLQRHSGERTLKLTVPAHNPVKRSTLSHLLKQGEIEVERFLKLL
ncbi:MAG: type II toxin-antitoxin system HicA family toxin [Chloroflexi bacterium]|nr:type II toxin-antitoxin system HicA family toxin [Chloroflexota bacterium]